MGEGGELFGIIQRKRNELCWQLQAFFPPTTSGSWAALQRTVGFAHRNPSWMPIKPISLEIHVL